MERVGLGSVKAMLGDKDVVGKDYLGEVGEWFGTGEQGEGERDFGFDEPGILCVFFQIFLLIISCCSLLIG